MRLSPVPRMSSADRFRLQFVPSVSIPMDNVSFARPSFLAGVELVSATYGARRFPIHTHDTYVVGTVTGGAERLDVGRARHVVAQGSVLRLHPEEAHSNCSLGSEPLSYRVFYLSEKGIQPYLRAEESLRFTAPVIADRHLGARLAALHCVLSAEATLRLEQESAMATLVELLGPSRGNNGERPVGSSAVIRRVQEFVDAYHRDDFGLTTLAEVAGLSVYRFAHLFKMVTGLSPIAYRNQCRIRASRPLLLDGQPIASIALDLGFADQSHFTRHFQRIVGVSPARYRQQ